MTDLLKKPYEAGATATGTDPMSELSGGGVKHKVQNAQLVISLVVLGVVAIVGILIFSEVEAAIEVDGDLGDSVTDLEAFFGDAMSLVGIAMIVAVAALIIAFVAGMGGQDPRSGIE